MKHEPESAIHYIHYIHTDTYIHTVHTCIHYIHTDTYILYIHAYITYIQIHTYILYIHAYIHIIFKIYICTYMYIEDIMEGMLDGVMAITIFPMSQTFSQFKGAASPK